MSVPKNSNFLENTNAIEDSNESSIGNGKGILFPRGKHLKSKCEKDISQKLNDLQKSDPGVIQSRHPRELLKIKGARCLNDKDLLTVLLSVGSKLTIFPEELAEKILAHSSHSIFNLSRYDISEFKLLGATFVQRCNLIAAFELIRRTEERVENGLQIKCAGDVFLHFEKEAIFLDREKCWVLCVDSKNKVIRIEEVTTGIANASLFHPRDFLSTAVRSNACGLFLVHNHPSGDSTPSQNDISVTKRLRAAAEIMEIRLIDHIILGRKNIPPQKQGFFSFSESGIL